MIFLAPLGWLFLALILFAIPGWGILAWWFPPWERLSFIEKIALGIGLSLALYPLLYLYTDLIGLHLGGIYPWLLVLLGIGLISWRFFQHRKRVSHPLDEDGGTIEKKHLFHNLIDLGKAHLPELVLLGVLALTAFTRYWPVRNLEIPMWGDSYQHSLIAQLLVLNKGLFQNWQPYAELKSFTYHFGFHTLVASFQELTGLPIYLATLWVGQILNLFALLALYPLAVKVGSSRWAGVGAVVLAAFLSPMPMFYTNWGRYTQLTGQVILPAAIFLILAILDSGSLKWQPTLVIGLILAGLGLTHYLVTFFAGLFYIAYLILESRHHNIRLHIKQIFWQIFCAGLLFLPWLARLFQGKLPLIFRQQVADSVQRAINAIPPPASFGNLQTYLPAFLWIAFVLSLSWGLWRRNQLVALIGLWWLMIVIAANMNWLGLPGADTINNFSVLIAFYIPAGIIIGGSAGWFITDQQTSFTRQADSLPELKSEKSVFRYRTTPFIWAILLILLTSLSLWGARHRLRDIQPGKYSLVTSQDLEAIDWMRKNLPDHSRILVNSFFAYGGSLIVGSDAGWWLPLLSGQDTTLPPLNYGMEQGPFPDYRQWVNELTGEIQARGVDDPRVLNMLAERGVTHVFIGQQQGSVNNPKPLVEVASLLNSLHYQPIYNIDKAWVFKVINP